jgi:hypothetical protein
MIFKSNKQDVSPIKPSSEEQFIKNYLDDNDINYIAEYKIFDLKYDSKKSRRVDFYLPKLGVYLEYFGWYNKSKQVRADYDEKASVYIKNGLPTVILYPHELGILDYAFHNKLLKVLRLQKFNKKNKLRRYKLNRYLIKGNSLYFFLSFFILLLTVFITKDNNQPYDIIFGVGFAISIQTFWLFIRNLVRIIFLDY